MFAVSDFREMVTAILGRPDIHVGITVRIRALLTECDRVRGLGDVGQSDPGKAPRLVGDKDVMHGILGLRGLDQQTGGDAQQVRPILVVDLP